MKKLRDVPAIVPIKPKMLPMSEIVIAARISSMYRDRVTE